MSRRSYSAALMAAAAWALFAGPAIAEGFVVEARVETPLPPAEAYRAFTKVQDWWAGSHTYSGDAKALRLDPRAGGCWCERLKNGGSVEHMRVVYAAPGETLRLVGGLGPLQSLPATAVMTVSFAAKPEGRGGTALTLTYAVEGPGVGALERPVSGVLNAQLARYAARRP